MDLEESCSSFKDFDDDGSDLFKSLIEDDSDHLSRNQCTIQIGNNLQRSTVQDSSYLVRESDKSEESDQSLILEQPELIQNLNNRQPHNRFDVILQRTRPKRKLEKQKFNLDTSAILIQLLNSKRIYRLAFNFYIFLNIVFRVMCFGITFLQCIVYSLDNRWSCWGSFGGFCLTRILFGLSIYKLLNIGEQTKDKSIKMVYETYMKWFEDIQVKIRVLERDTNSLIRRNQADEDQFQQQTKEINRLQKRLLFLKTHQIFIPPELSFLYFRKQSNGFFQVQNFIMKSIELFYFMPAFLYFIIVFNVRDVERIVILDFTEHQIQHIFSILVVLDIFIFLLISLGLLYLGNKKQKVKPI
ncbi:unnamed protein product (macronuclear) [Paramecium tetraurelia]|uniref:Abscisic acid G-protein coupled receptor-like domain-containing protein n=1 Tax=Paramecium tetraurelia TaxID=5888 RepID=A0D844_PARTE|nr:uncharacterized protein GSPATT00014178001 [Paramecium tetraurelia]CAK79211.1 unnamed protein product [Paramecium tetraurelia]|eukprot:XP_001446608.1 hypothetical protein (macronuclear) [Paramecium tetraurelia strain d4-2]